MARTRQFKIRSANSRPGGIRRLSDSAVTEFVDNRSATVVLRKAASAIDDSPQSIAQKNLSAGMAARPLRVPQQKQEAPAIHAEPVQKVDLEEVKKDYPMMMPGLATLEATPKVAETGYDLTKSAVKGGLGLAGDSVGLGLKGARKVGGKGLELAGESLKAGAKAGKGLVTGGASLGKDLVTLGGKGVEGSMELGVAGVKGSLGLAGKGMKASADLALAPARLARERYRKAKGWRKKGGALLLGALGTAVAAPLALAGVIGSGALGLAGAGLSAGAGLTGAALSGGAGLAAGGVSALGGLAAGGTAAALGGVGALTAAAGGGALAAGSATAGLTGGAIAGTGTLAAGAAGLGLTAGASATTAGVGLGLSTAGGVGTGLWEGAKKAGRGIKSIPSEVRHALGNYSDVEAPTGKFGGKDGARRPNHGRIEGLELANYAGQGLAAAGAGVKSSTAYTGAIAEGTNLISGDTTGWKLGLAGARDTVGIAGAVGGGLGAAASLVDFKDAVGESRNTANDKTTRKLARLGAASSLADATKNASSSAFNVATLIKDAGSPVIAGAQIGAAGGAIAMGAVDMIRGGYGAYTANEREKVLKGIASTAQGAVKNIALDAAISQNRQKKVMTSKVLKGAVSIAGGVLLVAAMTNPIGWAILGGASIIGGIAALWNYLEKKKSKKAVAIRELGVEAPQAAWEEKKKKEVSSFRNKIGYLPGKWEKENPEPVAEALKKDKFISVGHFFSNYIDYTANYLYTEGVAKKTSAPDAQVDPQVDQLCKIVEGMGLNIDTKTRKPQPKDIAKKLGA